MGNTTGADWIGAGAGRTVGRGRCRAARGWRLHLDGRQSRLAERAQAGPGAGAREEPGVHLRAGGAWLRSGGDGLRTAGNSATAAWSGHRPGRESTGPEPARATAVRAGRCGIRAGTSARGRGRAARGMRWHPECRGQRAAMRGGNGPGRRGSRADRGARAGPGGQGEAVP